MDSGNIREYSFRIENAAVKIVLDGVKTNYPKYSELFLHTHSFAEIFMCDGGTAFLKTEGGILAFEAGECVIMPVGCRHKIILNSDGKNYRAIGILCEKIGTDSELYAKLVRIIDTTGPCVIKKDTALSDAVKNISDANDEWTVFCETLTVVKSLSAFGAGQEIKDIKRISDISKNIDRLVEFESLLNAHFTTDLSYCEIAAQLHISERQLIRLVKKYYGVGLRELIRGRRMEIAAKLLSDSELPIEEIATDIGYKSKAAFYNVFGNFFGTTPAAYRKTKREV